MKKKGGKIKLYLDTSVISALFDKRSPDMMYWTHEFWKFIGNFDVFISDVVATEIHETPDTKLRAKMLKAIEGINVLEIDEDSQVLSNEYVRHGAVPEKYHRDAFHIGIATVNHVEALISWNYKHIVRRKTREVVRMVNALYNYPFIEIMSPPEILGGEEE